MFGKKRFDLRVKDMFAMFRDSYLGATSSRTKKDTKKEAIKVIFIAVMTLILLLVSYFVSTNS